MKQTAVIENSNYVINLNGNLLNLKTNNIMKNIHVLPTDKSSRLCKGYYTGLHLTESMISNVPAFVNQNIYITNDEGIKEGWHFNNSAMVSKPVYLKNEDVKALKSMYGENPNHLQKIILTDNPDLIKDGVQAIDDEFLEWFVDNPSCEEVETIYGLFNTMGRQVDPMNLGQNHSQCVWKYKIIIQKKEIKSIKDKIEDFVENCREGHLDRLLPKEEHKQECKGSFKDCFNSLDKCVCDIMKQETLEGLTTEEITEMVFCNKQETLEEVAKRNIPNRIRSTAFGSKFEWEPKKERKAFIRGYKLAQERSYNEEEMKQFAFQCVANFLSNNNNKVEMSLVEIITDRNNEKFEQFKNK